MNKKNLKHFFTENIVTIIFLVICLASIIVADQPIVVLVRDITQRFSRNTFIVLALIIPVVAGLGLNFAIIIGAMAAQIAMLFVMDFNIGGFWGIILAMALSVPLAFFFGWLIGKLLNKTRGQEMIASLIAGFFAIGIYQLLFLGVMGRFIPIRSKELLIPGGVGIRNTINLTGSNGKGLKYALDELWQINFFMAMMVIGILFATFILYILLKKSKKMTLSKKLPLIFGVILSSLMSLIGFIGNFTKSLPKELQMIKTVKVPVITWLFIAGAALFTHWIFKTKLGQDFRSVGQSQSISKVSGINVDKTRITAMIISMILAAWGHIILLQNVGVLNTYGSHVSIGLYGVAALLVGGATVNRASIGQAFLGVILFHTLFFIAPFVGKVLLNDAQNAEYFRNIIAYGVIGLSLVLYAWKQTQKAKE